MPSVKYGNTVISYEISEEAHLKNSYIQVEQGMPVLYRTKEVDEAKANKQVLKKAGWVLEKLKLVAEPYIEQIRTGSRIPYLGKKYYTEVFQAKEQRIAYTSSKFQLYVEAPEQVEVLMEQFYRQKCLEKIKPRFNRWVKLTGLKPVKISFRKFEKRWGSCTKDNHIYISTEAVKLPWQLIDYLILHELCHIKYKDHTKAFWKELERWMPDYKERDEKMNYFKI